MVWGEGGQARVRMQSAGSVEGQPIEGDRSDDKANPDLWRDRAQEARARAGVLRNGNLRTALLSIAEGFERLGLRARDVQRTELPSQAAAIAPSGHAEPAPMSLQDRPSSSTNTADSNLADTFRTMETLAPKPLSPAMTGPDRVERVARVLCHADGRDPDRSIETGQWETVVSGGLQTRRPVTLRGWKVYVKDARQFLAALDAAQDRS